MSDANGAPLSEFAPAKINLTLAVGGRRADGYHDLTSLVAFASVGDELTLVPASRLSLEVRGPFAADAGTGDANLVVKAAGALARRVPGLRFGAFTLDKHIPVAAGLGGGSADAAAALRLLARLNGLASDDAALIGAAIETGSDVPVCLAGGCRVMRGRGEVLGPPVLLPGLHAVLVNPGVALGTARVFGAFTGAAAPPDHAFVPPAAVAPGDWLAAIASHGNDLEAPALALEPAVGAARDAVARQDGCRLARMTGSGATVFGLFDDAGAAGHAAERLGASWPGWWVRAA